MKNLFSLFFKKANSTKHLLCLLFLIAFIAPIGSKAQSSFTCSFGNPDGPNVIPCGSVVTATITFPANIENITLTFPNSFQVTTPMNGAVFDATLSSGSLCTVNFLTANNVSPMTVAFAYRGCNVSGNGADANTSNLFFDCVSIIGNETLNADIVNPTTGIGLPRFENESASANHSPLPPISITTTQTGILSGAANSTYERVFTVTINSLSIETFDLGINNETDILLSSPNMLTIDGPTATNIDFNYGDNVFNAISLDVYSANVTQTNGIRTLTFRQPVVRLCGSGIPLSTSVSARLNCVCDVTNSGFPSSSIVLNSAVINEINFQNISSNLTFDSGTPGCNGIYNYDILIKVAGTNANLQSISVPINSTNFNIVPNGAVSYASSTINYPAVSDLSSLNYTVDPTQNPTNITINLPPGTYINVPLFFRFRLQLNYTCSTTPTCENTIFSLTPQTNNNITFNLGSPCGGTYPIVSELPEITEPLSAPTTIIGGATNLSYVTPGGGIPFNYQFTLPTTSPFSLIYSANNNTIFDCQNTSYRAVLSLVGSSFDNQTLQGLSINNIDITTPTAISNGQFIIDLPPNIINPGVYDIDFNLEGISCPPSPNNATFGSYTFQLSIQAVCTNCTTATEPPCVRNVACASDLLFVHCPGDCDGLIGIDPGVTIKRSTFGWANEADYPNTPITNESFFDNLGADEKDRQLHRMYPYDVFTVNATGELKNFFVNQDQQLYTHNWVGFRMNFSNTGLGEDFFNLIDYTITFSPVDQVGQTAIVINDLTSVEFISSGVSEVAGIPDGMFQRELKWDLLTLGEPIQTALNTGTWAITFTARFRVTATSQTVDIGFYPLDFQCQFISESELPNAPPAIFTSCDPYGASILVLIPEVQVAQQSVQTFDNTSTGNLLVNTNSVGEISNNACSFNHIIGLRHRGGLGDAVDDFPFEFRPLSAWGNTISANILTDVDELYLPVSNTFTGTAGSFTNANTNLRLLPAMEKGDIENNFQGLNLKLDKNCTNTISSIPLTLQGTKNYAYLHQNFDFSSDASINQNLINQAQLLTINNAIIPTIDATDFNVINLINLPSSTILIPNGTSTFNFSIASPDLLDGIPTAFVASVVLPAGATPGSVTLDNFIFDGVPASGNLVGFTNGIPNVNASFNINLGNDINNVSGCFDQEFEIQFTFYIFCTETQLNDFVLSNNNSCPNPIPSEQPLNNFRSTTRTFKRVQTSLTQTNISNNFEQDDCNLIWNLQVTNPSLIPIDVSTLNLNFATGLIYNSGSVSMNCGPNPPDNSNPPTILSLSNPSFQFITDNFNNSSIQTTLGIQGFGAGLPLLLLQPGCTLNYRLNFSTTNEICSLPSFDNTNIINANFTYSNICNDDTETPTNDGLMTMPIAVNNGGSNLSNIMSQLSNGVNANGSPCCVASSFAVQHACGTTDGSISYTNTFQDNVEFNFFGLSIPPTTIVPGQTISITLPVGNYGIFVFNGTTGAFFTADISIENHGFTAELNDVTICDGQNFTLVPTIDPATPPSGLVYTYEWNTLETTETVTVNSAATYSVNISNESCSALTDADVIVNPIPVMTSLSFKNICSGTNIEIELTANHPSSFSWTIGTITGGITGASPDTGSTINQILVNPSNATAGTVQYIVTPTATLGPCVGAPFIITVTVYPMPTLSSALTASICNNTLFSYSPISSIPGATLTWTRAAVTGITNAAIITPQSSNPNETLSLTSGTTSPVNVVYVYTIQTNECRNNVNVTVTVNPITNNSVSISANNGNSICSGTSVTFTATPNNGGAAPYYAWTVNGTPVVGINSATYTTAALTGTANVQVSMTSSFVCANPLTAVSNNIIVTVIPSTSPFCQCACTDPTTGASLPSLPITSFTQLINDYTSNISNKCLYFQNDISIASNLTLQNCLITVAPGKRIVVEENINFAAINTTFRGCEQMWVGIQNRGRVKFIGNTIRDARIGFEMVRVTSSFPFTWLNGITFSNNFIGLSNSWALGNHRFAGPNNCVFEGGQLLSGYAGQIPAPNPAGGLAGMRVQRRFIVAINQTNKFSNLYNGLLVLSSTVKVDGALFENIKGTNLYPNNNVPLGTSLSTFLQTYSNHPRFPSAAINASYGSQVSINGLGSEQGSTPMFFGCTRSICSHAGRMGVSNVFIDGDDDNPAWIGMYFLGNSNANSFNVQNNRIRTNQTGILLLENGANTGGINSAVVTNNNITVLDHFDLSPSVNVGAWKAGIYSSSLLNTDARRSQISNNTINIRSMNRTDGILTLTSNGIGINNNLIRRFTPSTGSGIDIQNNLMAKIECNSSLGMSTDVMSAQNQAYSVFGSNFTLRENYSNLTRNGFALFGDCTDIQFYRNQMGQHQNIGINSDPNGALYIGSSAVLGPQQDRFNLFLNGNYAFRAMGSNASNVFLVDPPQMAANPDLYPLHDPADPDNQCAPDPFFRCLDNLDLNELIGEPCGIAGSSVVGSMRTNPIGAEGIAAALINGELNFDTYNEESKFEVSKSIVRGIKDQTINLPNTPIYENWKDSIAQSNTSRLTESAIKWRKENYSTYHEQLAENWKASSTESYEVAMDYFENIHQPEDYDNPIFAQDYLELLDKEEIANNLLESLKQLNDSDTQEKIDSTAYWNNLVIDPTDYEELERITNEIYLNTLAKGEFEFSASQWYQISQIAFLCPLKSASAVYKARGMYSIVDPTANFDDYSICLNQGMQYRTANSQQNNVPGVITIKQLDQTLQVNYTGKSSLQSIRILNNLGQVLTQWQSAIANNQQQTISINNLNMQNGLYILQAQSADGNITNRKFIFTK